MASQPPSTSASAGSSSSSSLALDSAAHRSCSKCYRRMSSYKYDEHTLCLHCRDVLCSVDLRCRECSLWSTEMMQNYVKHRKSLVSEGKKSSVATPTSTPSVLPSATPASPAISASVAPPTPALMSIASDQSIKAYVHSLLASFLSHPASQFSLGSNPFVSAPMAKVPNVSHRGSTGGSDAESLMRGRQITPGMVPRPQEEVISSLIMSVSVASSRSVSVPESLSPSSGQPSAPVNWVNDLSRVRGATGFGFDNVSVNVTNVACPPSASTSFDTSALLFSSSDFGFSSRSFPRLPKSSSSAPSLPRPISAAPPIFTLAPSAPSISVPVSSLPSVVPSLLSSSSSSSIPSFSAPPVPPLSVPFSAPPSHPSSLSFSAHSFPSSLVPPPGFSAPASVLSSAPPFLPSSAAYPGPSSSSAPFAPTPSLVPPEDLPNDVAPDALPRDVDPSAAVPYSSRSEFRRMLSFIVDLFPQAAGTPPAPPPPPRALFEDFFGSSAPPSSPVFLNWYELVRTALADADSRMASFLATGRGDFSFLPSRNASYAVHGEFAAGHAAPVNPSLLSLFERQLMSSHLVGMSIREAEALEASVRSQSEILSHSMWILTGLLASVRLQNFAPEDSSLFNTLVTSLSKSLAHQATLTASHTAFLALKRRRFYLSHLPAYFSDVSKRSMLSAPAVCADFLFAESDVARLLSDTQTSLSLRSQQALVDVLSRSAGARFRRSLRCSPARQSPSRRRRRESGSPPCGSKRVCFASPASNSALKAS